MKRGLNKGQMQLRRSTGVWSNGVLEQQRSDYWSSGVLKHKLSVVNGWLLVGTGVQREPQIQWQQATLNLPPTTRVE